jgi:hypothetical protein
LNAGRVPKVQAVAAELLGVGRTGP